MRCDSYDELVQTPERHLGFLREIAPVALEMDNPAKLYLWMHTRIQVADQPFSQAKHLMALEKASQRWDLESLDLSSQEEVVRLSMAISKTDPGYDVSHSLSGFSWLKEEAESQGVDFSMAADPPTPSKPQRPR